VSTKRPNISQIRKYLNGELDARAMHQLERQAQDDPFLLDALEGYEFHKKDQQANLDDLQKRLQQQITPARKRVVLWPTIAIAASVLLFISVGGWLLINNRSVNTTLKPNTDNTLVTTRPLHPAITKPAPQTTPSAEKPVNSTPELRQAGNGEVSNPIANVRISSKNKSFDTNDASIAADAAAQPPGATGLSLAAQQAPTATERAADGLPGSNPSIRIRGVSSLTGKDPIYIVDGVMHGSNITDIATGDIKDIKVLKEASLTAIYGSRAANGVILVTTKKGKLTKPVIDSNLLAKNVLNEVVVTGYPTQQRKDITASVSTVQPVQIEQALQGRVAGVQVTKSGKTRADSLQIYTGRVLAKSDRLPIPGVSVKIEGKSVGAVTDAEGKFKIKASPGDELLINYIGYQPKKIKAKGEGSLNVALEESKQALSEVVVVGYGSTNTDFEPQNAQPQQGWSTFNTYIKENAKPVNGKTGVVRLSFVVNANRTLSNFKILKSLSDEADKAAIKLIEDGPDWVPNTNGKPETVRLRISFKL
jgi:TonB family protein